MFFSISKCIDKFWLVCPIRERVVQELRRNGIQPPVMISDYAGSRGLSPVRSRSPGPRSYSPSARARSRSRSRSPGVRWGACINCVLYCLFVCFLHVCVIVVFYVCFLVCLLYVCLIIVVLSFLCTLCLFSCVFTKMFLIISLYQRNELHFLLSLI